MFFYILFGLEKMVVQKCIQHETNVPKPIAINCEMTQNFYWFACIHRLCTIKCINFACGGWSKFFFVLAGASGSASFVFSSKCTFLCAMDQYMNFEYWWLGWVHRSGAVVMRSLKWYDMIVVQWLAIYCLIAVSHFGLFIHSVSLMSGKQYK